MPGNTTFRAFLYDDGAMINLGTFGGSLSNANAINAGGEVVGWATSSTGSTRAFLYSDGVMTDLNNEIPTGSGVTLVSALLINGSGHIVAEGQDSNGQGRVYLLTPEPPPPPTRPDLVNASDTGVSSTDDLTNDSTPTFAGTAEPGSTVRLYDGATQVGQATADTATGAWTITATPLSHGSHSLTATAANAAGSVSSPSTALGVFIDLNAPTLPSIVRFDGTTSLGANSNAVSVPFGVFFNETSLVGIDVTDFDLTTTGPITGVSISAFTPVSGNFFLIHVNTGTGDGTIRLNLVDNDSIIDAAGNPLGGTGVATIPGPTYFIDKTGPSFTGLSDSPDPFSPNGDGVKDSTTISFTLDEFSLTTLRIYDSSSTLIRTTNLGNRGDGPHFVSWDGRNDAGSVAADGAYTYTLEGVDALGNAAVPRSGTVVVDTAAPAVSVPDMVPGDFGDTNLQTDNVTRLNRPRFQGTAEPGSTVTLSSTFGAGTVAVGTGTADAAGLWTITPSVDLADGSHALTARATDPAGNVSAPSASLTVWIDTVRPANTVLYPVAGGIYNTAGWDAGGGTPEGDISGTATDGTGSGVISVNLGIRQVSTGKQWNGSTFISGGAQFTALGTTSWVFPFEGANFPEDGSYTIFSFSRDLAGNSETPRNTTFTIDNTAPIVSLSGPAALTNLTTASLTFTATDNITPPAGLALLGKLDDGAFASVTSPQTFAGLADGTHLFTLKVIDQAGNVTERTHVWTVDTAPPATTGAPDRAPNAHGWYNADVVVTLAAADENSGVAVSYYRINGGATETYSGPFPVATEGVNTVEFWSVDEAGNVELSQGLSLRIDKTLPTMTAQRDTPANGYGWNNTDVAASYSASDTLSGLATPTAGSHTFTAEGAGQSHTFMVTDLAGNIASATVNGINIDKTAPLITAQRDLAPNAHGWNNTGVFSSYSASDPLSGLPVGLESGSFEFTEEGAGQTHSFAVTDLAGNTASATVSGVNIDLTSPTISGGVDRAPSSTGWYNSSTGAPNVNFTALDSLSGLLNSPAPMPVGEGANQFFAAAVADLAGNMADVTVGPLNVDVTAPVPGAINVPTGPFAVGSTVSASAALTEATSGIASATWDWNANAAAVLSPGATGGDNVVGSHTYAAAGVYTVSLGVVDIAGNSGVVVFAPDYVVIYDPSAGFVTGGGTIESPPGAFVEDPSLTGRATFGFVSRYHRGANVPTGHTEFRFHMANFSFRSTSYEWLVVGGSQAQYRGLGTVNGSGTYGFLLTAVDGQELGGNAGVDRFRIKIWRINPDGTEGAVVYDNGSMQSIASGNVIIHR
jgi:probable HAF family extracellular repeat protein